MNYKTIRQVDIYLGIPLAYLVFSLKSILEERIGIDTQDNYKNILLIKFCGLGNVAMLLPTAKVLKSRYPGARIDFLTLTSNNEISLAAGVFDSIYTIDTTNSYVFSRTAFKNLFTLKKNKYDLVIDFEQFARFSALFCALIGKKARIGFDTRAQHRQFLYTDTVKYNNNIHITKSFYQLVELVGVNGAQDFKPVPIFCSESDMPGLPLRALD
ncbi:MAG: hypothetical protein V2A59_00115 [Candidatus Omnitrophota bacterium]